MYSVSLKLIYLLFMIRIKWIRSDFKEWNREVWSKSLDDYWCCSSYDYHGPRCGCKGITVEEYIKARLFS